MIYTAAFEIPDGCTLSVGQMIRQAYTLLTSMIPSQVKILSEFRFTVRGRWLVAEADATGPVDEGAARMLADMVRPDLPDMAAWVDIELARTAA